MISGAVVALTLFFCASDVFAVNYHRSIYPGTAFLPSAMGTDYDYYEYSSFGKLYNRSASSTMYTTLAVSRRESGALDGAGNGISMVVYFNDESSTGNISCTTRISDVWGTSWASLTNASSGVSESSMTMTIENIPDYYTISLRCSVPPKNASGTKSYIKHVYYSEFW
jgi:hypothetical protein